MAKTTKLVQVMGLFFQIRNYNKFNLHHESDLLNTNKTEMKPSNMKSTTTLLLNSNNQQALSFSSSSSSIPAVILACDSGGPDKVYYDYLFYIKRIIISILLTVLTFVVIK
jgi:hypothetical protein